MRILLIAVSALALGAVACSGTSKPPDQDPLGGFGGFPDEGGSGGSGVDCDVDGDGFQATSCGGDDCDDTDPAIYKGAAEQCNGKDDNCDGTTDEGCSCQPGDLRSCFSVMAGQHNVGECRDGWQQCQKDGTWDACKDEVVNQAAATTCDGKDHDCDGKVDNAQQCTCTPRAEICGNGLDDDCDGIVDNPAVCNVDCSALNVHLADLGGLNCCGFDPVTAYESTCDEYDGFPSCTNPQRTCEKIDKTSAVDCTKGCRGSSCVCGAPGPVGQLPIPDPACGFLSPCSHVDCDDRLNQPCYDKAWNTLGKGICHAGTFSCERQPDGSKQWNSCVGEVGPGLETCGNHIDDDCDGLVDENDDATGMSCLSAPACQPDAKEICGDKLDNDCDGFVDEGCPAAKGATQQCWTGDLLPVKDRTTLQMNGVCKTGSQHEVNGTWGPCEGEVLPGPEICGDHLDTDCNGLGGPDQDEDPYCCVPGDEVCNGKDDNCNGMVDEGLLSACGTCSGEPCHEVVLDNLPDCTRPGRTCTQIQPFELDPGAITLAASRPTALNTALWGALPGAGMTGAAHVVSIDINSGTVTKSIASPTNSHTPAEVATELDGSVWVLYTGFGGRNYVEHFDNRGTLICAIEEGALQHIGPEADGGIWAVTTASNKYFLRRFTGAPDTNNPNPDSKPRCVIQDLAPGDSSTTDVALLESGAIASDANHWVWVAGNTMLQRVDALNPTQVIQVKLPVAGAPGRLTVGTNDWVITSHPVRAISAPSGQIRELSSISVNDVVAVPDGTIWVNVPNGAQPDAFLHMDQVTGRILEQIPLAASRSGSTGVAIDASGRIWTAQTNEFYRLDPAADKVDTFSALGRTVIQSNSTAVSLRDIPLRRGKFTQLVDPGTFEARWETLSFDAHATEGTRILVFVRFADTPTDLDTTKFVCGPFESGPADLAACSGGRRYARVEIWLSGGGGRPSVNNVKMSWDTHTFMSVSP